MAFRRKVPGASDSLCCSVCRFHECQGALYSLSVPVACQATGDCSISSARKETDLWVREASGYDSPRRAGTLPPPLRASERPIAIACSRLLTGLPDFPDLSLPSFIACIALLTFVAAFGPYCLWDDLIGIFFKLYFDRFDVSEPKLFFAHKLMPEQVHWICSGSRAYLDLPQQSL